MTSMILAAAAAATFSFGEVKVDCEERDGWKLEFSREVAPDGAEIAKIALDCAEAKVPPKTIDANIRAFHLGLESVQS
mgnify:CR=1 FL=1